MVTEDEFNKLSLLIPISDIELPILRYAFSPLPATQAPTTNITATIVNLTLFPSICKTQFLIIRETYP